MRLLLLKQDRVSELEAKLQKVDKEEAADLFLRSFRLDKNLERKKVLEKLDDALKEYGIMFKTDVDERRLIYQHKDSFLQRTHWAHSMPEPSPIHHSYLKQWMDEKHLISRREASYLNNEAADLMNIGNSGDREVSAVAPLVARSMGLALRAWRWASLCFLQNATSMLIQCASPRSPSRW